MSRMVTVSLMRETFAEEAFANFVKKSILLQIQNCSIRESLTRKMFENISSRKNFFL